MKELARRVLDKLTGRRSVDYADVRVVETLEQSVHVKNASPESIASNDSAGLGLRVVVDGAWGFASTGRLDPDSIDRCIDAALAVARSSRVAAGPQVRLWPLDPLEAEYITPHRQHPMTVPLEQTLATLEQACRTMMNEPDVRVAEAFYQARHEHKLFVSTDDRCLEQTVVECGGGIAARAVRDGVVQVRSYPNSFRGNIGTAGYEFFESLGLADQAARVASEAAALVRAPVCPAGQFDLVIDPSQLALQVHESIGHPIELDRVLGTEAAFAGTSFLKPTDLDTLRYGSDVVNVVADATAPTGLGTFGFDDEGVAARRQPIVENGIFRGFLSSRETAHVIDRPPTGAMRASGYGGIPLVRMTNINLLPGSWTLDDLLADTEDGLLLSTNRSWSIDDRRLNFQFGVEAAWHIKGGKPDTLYRDATYTGITPRFWSACDAVCNADHWRMWGTPNCGKGQPMQIARVGHGTSPARFRGISVSPA